MAAGKEEKANSKQDWNERFRTFSPRKAVMKERDIRAFELTTSYLKSLFLSGSRGIKKMLKWCPAPPE